MIKEKLKSLLVLVVFCLMGCAVNTVPQSSEETSLQKTSEAELIICTDPRPEVCTMDYRPVCAERKDDSHKTYSNGCTACSDHEVIGYREGECKKK